MSKKKMTDNERFNLDLAIMNLKMLKEFLAQYGFKVELKRMKAKK